jgi:hypothetical protein
MRGRGGVVILASIAHSTSCNNGLIFSYLFLPIVQHPQYPGGKKEEYHHHFLERAMGTN